MEAVQECVVVVEDEANLNQSLSWAFRGQGWDVRSFTDGQACWEWYQGLRDQTRSVLVVDITMPRMDGLELCRRIRSSQGKEPLVFLTSRDEEIDRVLGLELGADDYVCKPFSLRELLTRVRVQFRRLAAAAGVPGNGDEGIRSLARGDLVMWPDACRASWRGCALDLTVSEFRIVEALANLPGVVKTRDQLSTAAHGEDLYLSDRVIDSHIKRLRRKFAACGSEVPIGTVYGLGYRWEGVRG